MMQFLRLVWISARKGIKSYWSRATREEEVRKREVQCIYVYIRKMTIIVLCDEFLLGVFIAGSSYQEDWFFYVFHVLST